MRIKCNNVSLNKNLDHKTNYPTKTISVWALAEFSSYSLQYLRRLLRGGKQVGLKIGQGWLIDKMLSMHIWRKLNKPKIGDLVPNNFFLVLFTSVYAPRLRL
jgi:hypothetical protein